MTTSIGGARAAGAITLWAWGAAWARTTGAVTLWARGTTGAIGAVIIAVTLLLFTGAVFLGARLSLGRGARNDTHLRRGGLLCLGGFGFCRTLGQCGRRRTFGHSRSLCLTVADNTRFFLLGGFLCLLFRGFLGGGLFCCRLLCCLFCCQLGGFFSGSFFCG